VSEKEEQGAPAWMVSFGDMMTLILTFFILLVSMSKERQEGLVASGVGSFLIAIRSFGMPGLLDEGQEAAIHDSVRQRFNLPPEADPERKADHIDASNLELIRARAARALKPHDELNQPSLARFAHDSYQLDDASRRYIDLLAETLRPLEGQLLLLEGHTEGAGRATAAEHPALGLRRAQAVRRYLIDAHQFQPERVEPRVWLTELTNAGSGTRQVDARLVTPSKEEPR
jgi:chemotaxis protein MotB